MHRVRQPKKPPTTKTAHVRIIGGEYRRRLVSFVDADGLRPTPDRVRETVFNWLDPYLPNSRVLDCCAGSGVLGFEALSRGASHVSFIEPNFAQLTQLRQTASTLGIADTAASFYADTAQQVLARLPSNLSFDGVFVDPPYALDLWQAFLQLLLSQNLVTPKSWIYVEADRPLETVLAACIDQLDWLKQKKIGQIHVGLLHPLG